MPGEREDQTPTNGEPSSPDQRPAQSVFGNRGDLSFLGVPPPVSPPQPQTPPRPAEASASSTPPQEGPTAIITPGSSEDAIRAVETAAARPILPRITDEPSVSEDQPIMPPPAGPDTSAPLEPEGLPIIPPAPIQPGLRGGRVTDEPFHDRISLSDELPSDADVPLLPPTPTSTGLPPPPPPPPTYNPPSPEPEDFNDAAASVPPIRRPPPPSYATQPTETNQARRGSGRGRFSWLLGRGPESAEREPVAQQPLIRNPEEPSPDVYHRPENARRPELLRSREFESPQQAARAYMLEYSKKARERDYEKMKRIADELVDWWWEEADSQERIDINRRIRVIKSVIEAQVLKVIENPTNDPILERFKDQSYQEVLDELSIQYSQIQRALSSQGDASFNTNNLSRMLDATRSDIDYIMGNIRSHQQNFETELLQALQDMDRFRGLPPRDSLSDEDRKEAGVLLSPKQILGFEEKHWDDPMGVVTLDAVSALRAEKGINQFVTFVKSKVISLDSNELVQSLTRIRKQLAMMVGRVPRMNADMAQDMADAADAELLPFAHNERAKIGDGKSAAGFKAYFGNGRGRERMLSLVKRNKPDVFMKALHIIGHNPMVQAWTRPYGPRGELVNHAYMHGWLRDLVMENIVDELMRYEIKGDSETARAINVELAYTQLTEAQFNNLYKPRLGGAMPIVEEGKPTRRPDETEEAFNERKRRWMPYRQGETEKEFADRYKETENICKTAFQLNGFLGHQAEMRGASIMAENGDFVHRRSAEYYVKFRLIQKMREHGVNPLDLEAYLLSFKGGERTPRLTKKPHEIRNAKDQFLAMLAQEAQAAIQDLDRHGNRVTYRLGNQELGLEDIVSREEVQMFYEGYAFNDHPLRNILVNERVAQSADAGSMDYFSRIRRLIDPYLTLPPKGHNQYEKRQVAEAMDFIHRLQAESSMAVFEHFVTRIDQGSQGAGLLSETRIFDNRSSIAANFIEKTKYGLRLLAYIPEIYSFPMQAGCRSTFELIQLIALRGPDESGKKPEIFENFSMEIWADMYSKYARFVKTLTGFTADEEGMKEEKGFFMEEVSARELLLKLDGWRIRKFGPDADTAVEQFAEKHFKFARIAFDQIKEIFTNSKKAEVVNPASWIVGILYDEFMDWLISTDGGPGRLKGGQQAYHKRFHDGLKALFYKDSGVFGTGQTIWSKLKEKIATQPVSAK